MKAKSFFIIFSSFILSVASLTFTNITYAQPISLYEQPNQNAKVIGAADLSAGIIPIYTPTNGGDWIKVADPRNGNVGWVKSSDIKNAKGSANIFTQKIISNGNQQSLNDAQMQDYIQKMRAQQQAIQNSFQGILKNMNDLFQREWNMWNAQGGIPIKITPTNTPSNQASPNKEIDPQPATGNPANANPEK